MLAACFNGSEYKDTASYVLAVLEFRGACELSSKTGYPQFASIAENRDPATFELASSSNLAKNFGPGVELVSARYVGTDEPTTYGTIDSDWLEQIGQAPQLITGVHFSNRRLFRLDSIR